MKRCCFNGSELCFITVTKLFNRVSDVLVFEIFLMPRTAGVPFTFKFSYLFVCLFWFNFAFKFFSVIS